MASTNSRKWNRVLSSESQNTLESGSTSSEVFQNHPTGDGTEASVFCRTPSDPGECEGSGKFRGRRQIGINDATLPPPAAAEGAKTLSSNENGNRCLQNDDPLMKTAAEDGDKAEKWSKKFRKKACIIKLDGCHYTIVANTIEHSSDVQPVKPRIIPRAGSLTVLKRTMSSGSRNKEPEQIQSAGDVSSRATGNDDGISDENRRSVTSLASIFGSKVTTTGDLRRSNQPMTVRSWDDDLNGDIANVNALPATDSPEALQACSTRLKNLLKRLLKDEISKQELLINLDYAARVTENIYIVENSKRDGGDDDVLGVVEQESVPHEVREWLTMTFTRSSTNTRRRKEDRLKFRSVANAIRAGIMVDKIYRRMSSLTNHDAPPDVQAMLKKVDDWSFDMFSLNDASEGHALKYTGYELLHRHDLINKFKVNLPTLENFLGKLEIGYRKHGNPYHNLLHAADVAQTTNVIMTQTGLALWMTDLEIFATLTSALVHDFEHTGTTNTFHVNTSSELAIVYNDRAVLENYHVSAAFRLLREEEMNILSGLKQEEYREFRSLVIDLVLATDMSNHFQQIKAMKTLIAMPDNMEKSQVLSLLVHAADISHPAKNWALHRRWTELLIEEFFRQGDREAALGLPVSPLCDRSNTLVAESQIGFIDFIVEPTFSLLNESIEVMISSLQQQCTSVSSEKDDSSSSSSRPSSSSAAAAAAAAADDCAAAPSPRTPVVAMEFFAPSTPKSPHFPVRVQQLKQLWSTCLVENKSLWLQSEAKDVTTATLPGQRINTDEKTVGSTLAPTPADVLVLCDDNDDDDDDDEEEDDDDDSMSVYFDSTPSPFQLVSFHETE